MKFLHLVDFQHVDPVRTEETVINNLKKTMFSLETKFVVADYAWAYSINRHGIDYTQDVVNMFLSRVSDQSTLIFICQHILVERLDWGGQLFLLPTLLIQTGFTQLLISPYQFLPQIFYLMIEIFLHHLLAAIALIP